MNTVSPNWSKMQETICSCLKISTDANDYRARQTVNSRFFSGKIASNKFICPEAQPPEVSTIDHYI